ncbi:hypothetical protein H9L16_15125 [Thermomonas carbonis]|uniref:Phytanoyl-CoA dioxygenase family protein n=2 Tax=Thermomonas carbonis TaxID=1463158 RepID=A0A7G9SV35_9GAMM|nr:hypothetical protein H9L16_15125 [Thermomonas carbonis]
MLPYRKPTEGRDYWLFDEVLPNATEVRGRCMAKQDWALGFPRTQETWPGRRAIPALEAAELATVEDKVRQATGTKQLWVQGTPEGKTLNHNCVQVVGEHESGARPHTDSRALCRYAGVLYLTPDAPEHCGTSFYRQRMPNGQLGGNTVNKPHDNLVQALGTRFLPPDSFVEDVRIPNKFNRLIVYSSAMIHSATAYCGNVLADERMAAVFFWMGV